MKIRILKKHPDAIIPEYATVGASGLDLHARIPHDIYLQPGVRFTCPVGIGIELPEGFEAQVRGRSGMAKNHSVFAFVGTIDCDFRGEICAILINHSDQAFKIEPNQRIAQLVIAPVVRVELVETDVLAETMRGDGGFGSTGDMKVGSMIIPKMTVEEALAFSDEWIKGVTLHEGSQGWRVVCWILAEEVRRRYGIGGELEISRKQRDEAELQAANMQQQLSHMIDDAAGLRVELREAEKQSDEYKSERQREHDLRVRISGELETVTKQRDELLANQYVTIQECNDGVWAHFRVGKGYSYSINLSADQMSRKFALEYSEDIARAKGDAA